MTPLWISGVTGVMTFGGGLLALRFRAYRGLVLAFCASALIAGALMDVIPEALRLLESTRSPFERHHLFIACSLGFLFFYLFEHAAHHSGRGSRSRSSGLKTGGKHEDAATAVLTRQSSGVS